MVRPLKVGQTPNPTKGEFMRLTTIVAFVLAGLLSAPALASQPKTPLTLEGQAAAITDGLGVRVTAQLQSLEPLREIDITITVDTDDALDLGAISPLAASGTSTADSATQRTTHHFKLDMSRTDAFSFRVKPRGAGNHRIEVVALAPRGNGNVWGDMFAWFYRVTGDTIAEGFDLPAVLPSVGSRFEGTPPQVPLQLVTGRATAPGPLAPLPASQSSPGGTTDGTLVVNGYWYMYDQNDVFIPQIERLVELVNTAGTVLAQAYTDLGGFYQFPGISNPQNFYIRLRTQVNYNRAGGSDFLQMRNQSGNGYFVTTATQSNVPDGTYNMGTWFLNNGDGNEGAYWAFNAMQATWRTFLFIHGDGNSYAGPMQAVWYPGSTEITSYSPGEYIHLNDAAPRSKDTVAHEAGHNTMYNAYGNYMPPNDCVSPHYIEKFGGTNCGWTEGWGDFTSMLVWGDPYYTFANGSVTDMESPTRGTFGWDNGTTCEGRVAGALWDIIDGNNETTNDFYTDPVAPIWDTFWNVNNDTFCPFWDATRGYGIKRSRDNELYQNTIDSCSTCIEDPYESDNNCAQATFEGVGSTYTYNHCGSEDWQYIDVQLDWTYTWETSDLGYSGDTQLAIYSSNCSTELAYNDDKGYGNWPFSSRVDWQSDRNGRVYVAAREYLARYRPHTSYDISLSRYCGSPIAADTLQPPDGTVSCSNTVVASWSGYTRTYDVVLDGSYACIGLSSNSCTFAGLADGPHSWYVVSHNACGSISYSPVYSFSVEAGTVPADTPTLDVGGALLSWTASAYTTTGYDVARGVLSTLLATNGDFQASTDACVANDYGSTVLDNFDVPDPGDGFFYVVRAVGCNQLNGSYDDLAPDQTGSRDAGIDAAGYCLP